ncbi:MAG: hypothetical protein WC455_25560, partial [Dehalococcoidia bacterium]
MLFQYRFQVVHAAPPVLLDFCICPEPRFQHFDPIHEVTYCRLILFTFAPIGDALRPEYCDLLSSIFHLRLSPPPSKVPHVEIKQFAVTEQARKSGCDLGNRPAPGLYQFFASVAFVGFDASVICSARYSA